MAWSTGAVYLPFLESQLEGPFVDFDNDTIKVMLVTSGYTFSSAHQFRSSATAFETSGTNYVAGGQIITNVVATTVGDVVVVNGDDSAWAGASSAAFSFRGAIIYKDTGNPATDPVISFHDFGSDQTNSALNVILQWSISPILAYSTVSVPVELADLNDVTSATPTNRYVLFGNGTSWSSRAITEADISDLQAYLTTETNDLTAAVVWANVPDANITQTSVTQHQAALSITESQISDLQSYLLNVVEDTTPQLGGNLDVNGSSIVSTANANINITPDGTGNVVLRNFAFNVDQSVGIGTDNYVLTYDNASGTISLEPVAAELADLTDVTSATPTNRNVLVANGSTWASRALVEADISDLQAYLTTETNDLTASVVWANVPDANITQSSVTQHQAALSITESQISDLGAYIENVVEDLTPQLGGNLDVQGFTINTSTVDGDIALDPNGTGNVILGNYALDGDQTVGVGQDNYVMTYDNATGLISLEAVAVPVEVNDLTAAVTWATVPDAFISQSSVTQHEAALTLSESQIESALSAATVFTANTYDFDVDQNPGVGQDNFVLTYDNGTGLISLEETFSQNWIQANNGADFVTAPVATGPDAIAIGNNVTANHDNAIVIGENSNAGVDGEIIIGTNISSIPSIAINVDNCTLIGRDITSVGSRAIVLGTGNNVGFATSQDGLISIGFNANVGDKTTPSIVEHHTIGIGWQVEAQGLDTIVIGTNAGSSMTYQRSVAIGPNVPITADDQWRGGTDGTTFFEFADGVFSLNGTTPSITSTTVNADIDIQPNGTGNVLLGNYEFDVDQTVGVAQDNHVLTYDNGTGEIALELNPGTTALQSVSDDPTPTLGGNLNVLTNSITTTTTNGDIDIQPNGTGNVILGNYEFDGDQAVGAVQDGYVLKYDNAAGQIELTPPDAVLIASGSATNVASLVFTDLVNTYGRYQLVIHDVTPATDGASLNMQVSTDNGSTFVTTATYNWALMFARIRSTGGAANGNEGVWQDTSMRIMSNMGTAVGEDGAAIIDIYDPTNTNHYTRISTRATILSAQPETRTSSVAGEYSATTAVDAFRILMSTGNIASVDYSLYGYRQA